MSLSYEMKVHMPPRAVIPPELRDDYARIRAEIRQILRFEANALRRHARGTAPRRPGSNKLYRGIRVRALREGRNTIGFEVVAPTFYGRFANTRGRSAGWWDEAVAARDQDIFDALQDAARKANTLEARALQKRMRQGIFGILAGYNEAADLDGDEGPRFRGFGSSFRLASPYGLGAIVLEVVLWAIFT